MLTAQTWYERGVDLSNAGRYAAARHALDRAGVRTTDPNLLARIAGTRAYIVLETGDAHEAAALCDTAMELPGLTDHTRAVLLGQRGFVELRRGDLEAALHALTRSADGLTDDTDRLGTILMNRGIVFLELGRTRRAGDDFARAAECLEALGQFTDAAKARHNQGYAALLAGDLVAASRLMDAARASAGSSSPVDAAVGDADRAEVLLAAGLPAEAARRLAAATRVYAARRLRQLQADATVRLARTLLYTDPRAAASRARSAARLYRAHGYETGALRADAVALRADVAAGRRSDALLEGLRTVATTLASRRLHHEAVDLRLNAVRVQVRRGELDAARTALSRPRVPADAPIVTRTLAHEVRAELAAARAVDRLVLREAAAGTDDLARWQSLFGSLDLQSSLNMHGRALTQAGIAAALRSRDPAVVFEWSERARQIASHSVAPRPPDDPQVADALAELRVLRLAEAPDPAAARRDAELRELVAARRWAVDGTGRVPERVTLDVVQRTLAGGDVLVAYLWSGVSLTALVVEPDGARIIDLGAPPIGHEDTAGLQAELDVFAEGLAGSIGSAVRRALERRLAMLSRELVDPVFEASARAADPAVRLALVTPGILAGVPWAMLPGLTGRTVTLPPSATRWAVRDAAPGARTPPRRAGFVTGPGVPRAPDETARASSAWSDAALIGGGAATTDRAAALARRVDVLHVTAHGRHAADNPHFSGIELVDGPWFGYDIEGLDRVPPVVLLSACELGRSTVDWGHEALGMARTWLHAGARCVIASPANVSDASACELLPAVHRLLVAGEQPAAALATGTVQTGVVSPFLCYGSGW